MTPNSFFDPQTDLKVDDLLRKLHRNFYESRAELDSLKEGERRLNEKIERLNRDKTQIVNHWR